VRAGAARQKAAVTEADIFQYPMTSLAAQRVILKRRDRSRYISSSAVPVDLAQRWG
jgi:hypothetical protein